MAVSDILTRKTTHFVLWAPKDAGRAPELIIGQFAAGNPPALAGGQRLAMTRVAGVTGLWEIAAADCGLVDGEIYHYWFEVDDLSPFRDLLHRYRCTDPAAFTVDWRLLADPLPPPYHDYDRQPAGVVRFRNQLLETCDPGGETGSFAGEPPLGGLPPNNQLVIYELPTAWTQITVSDSIERGVGTFQDVLALIDAGAPGANFAGMDALRPGRSYLTELGVNALELLPPADSAFRREWGYGTTNFFAPDFELGLPEGNTSPTANADLSAVVLACHRNGIRFFIDVVMAFVQKGPYEAVDFNDFHISCPGEHRDDPDALTSPRASGKREVRNGFGSTLLRYSRRIHCYDPVSGVDADIFPARELMFAYLDRWSLDFHIDGIRMDSVENVANLDFVRDFKERGHAAFRERWNAQGLGAGASARFLVVGEELSIPQDLLKQNRLDGLWNDHFRDFIRPALLGKSADSEPSFEETIRKAIDCRRFGFTDGAKAINYLTSHDVEGFRRERLFNFFQKSGVDNVEKRVKLGFVCLLTAVGIPMILAGEEFADQHDRFDKNGNVTQDGGKQVDPVNYSRLSDPFRKAIFEYVARLVKLRTTHPALGVNDVDFIHVDFNNGKRVLAWRRGQLANPVVVVANFSNFSTDTRNPNAEYVVRNWPATPSGRSWREVSQNRAVPREWIGREPIFSWEAKVYALA